MAKLIGALAGAALRVNANDSSIADFEQALNNIPDKFWHLSSQSPCEHRIQWPITLDTYRNASDVSGSDYVITGIALVI